MTKYKFSIKNMVCPRCIKVVRDELTAAGYTCEEVTLGEAVLCDQKQPDINHIRTVLENVGFELLEDRKERLVEQVKTLVIEAVQKFNVPAHQNFSDYLAEKTGKDYQYISSIFSATENITVEKYIILQKIEKVKELLVYNELTLSEMAWKLGYSSVAHLSNQFRQVTGVSPSKYKTEKMNLRKPLDTVGIPKDEQ
ncbi:helix-turn-helix transcriptional regulator [Cytophagaceae bacterium ABcell3]|nr:helix-turn-helix transcriptional regulator [Cytophagaceae bacterium ABcell3]